MPPTKFTVLNIAEKPSVARTLSVVLSGRKNSPLPHSFAYHHHSGIPSISKTRKVNGISVLVEDFHFTVTSVKGHISEIDFDETSNGSWSKVDPETLFTAVVAKTIKSDMTKTVKEIKRLAKVNKYAILWLDCDREGEYIAAQVAELCMRANPKIVIHRARFSGLRAADITRALSELTSVDENVVSAVEARQELDLRTGSIFTRFLTLRYRNRLGLNSEPVSYGPCQFPTLGFIVDRWLQRENFTSTKFYYLDLTLIKDGVTLKMNWDRGRMVDEEACKVIYELCTTEDEESSTILVNESRVPRSCLITNKREKEVSRIRPRPLNTVAALKLLNKTLKISGKKALQLLESLYAKGYISYPRTETEDFTKYLSRDAITELINLQRRKSDLREHVEWLIDRGNFTGPRIGGKDDCSHPPIHPLKLLPVNETSSPMTNVYEIVTRHFLACVSPDAKGLQTRIETKIGQEGFHATGLVIRDNGWLGVYPYITWGETEFPPIEVNDRVVVSSFKCACGETSPPPLLTEAQILHLMDVHGIGTDSSMADHIEKILIRKYALKENIRGVDKFKPTPLGIALVEGFGKYSNPTPSQSSVHIEEVTDENQIGISNDSWSNSQSSEFRNESNYSLDSIAFEEDLSPIATRFLMIDHLASPALRAKMETCLRRIEKGEIQKEDVIRDTLTSMRDFYSRLKAHPEFLDDEISKRVNIAPLEEVVGGRLRDTVTKNNGIHKGNGQNSRPKMKRLKCNGIGRGRGVSTLEISSRALNLNSLNQDPNRRVWESGRGRGILSNRTNIENVDGRQPKRVYRSFVGPERKRQRARVSIGTTQRNV